MFQQFIEKRKKERDIKLDENTIIGMHHLFMKTYNSWIPIEEFKKQPIVTMLGLLNMISLEIDEMRKEEEKLKRSIPGSGRKTFR